MRRGDKETKTDEDLNTPLSEVSPDVAVILSADNDSEVQQKTASRRREFTPELITLEQFAERMSISRSTVYNWLADGTLLAGLHHIRINRVVRILWNENLLLHLLRLSADGSSETPIIRLRRNGRGGRNRIALDAEYLE